MMPSHKIKNTVFDLGFRSKTSLLQENSSLGGFVKQSLMPVVDEVLTEHDLDDHVIYIDKLKIDLGSIQLGDFKSRIKRQLRTKLDTLLKSKIQDLHHTSGTQERIAPLTKRNLELIEHFLMTGTLPGPLNLKHGWSHDRRLQSILKQERSNFLRFLQKNSHRPQVIQRLVRQFSAGTVRQVARLLAPAQSEAALKAVDNILRRNQGRSSSGIQAAEFKALVWELLLDYLLQNQKSRFTAAEFVNWINRKVERLSMPAKESLTAALYTAPPGQKPHGNLATQPGHPPKTIPSKKEARKIFKGYDLYEALRFYLQHGMMPWSAGTIAPGISVIEIIDELAVSYPEKLLKFAKELQYGPDLCQSLAEKLTPAVMKQFITALLVVSTPGNDRDRSTFIRSITEFADRAADRKGYYAEILRNLVTRQPIDLKQIAAQNNEPSKAETGSGVFEPGPDPDLIRAFLTAMLKAGGKTGAHDSAFSRLRDDLETNYPSEYREYLAWLAANKKRVVQKDRLVELSSQSQSNKSSLPGEMKTEDETALISYMTGDRTSRLISDTAARIILKRMVRHGSDSLYASLRNHLKDRVVRKKMITLLPENLLTRVLAGLRPDLYLPVQKYADIIADACFSEEITARPEEISRLKWEFVFAHLAQSDNRRFQESVFIRRFIDFLSDKIRQMDKTDLSDVLIRNLKAGVKPSIDPAVSTVLKELNNIEDATKDLKQEPPGDLRETAEDMLEDLFVQNAGMVIAAPYLPQLWNMLGLIEGGQFKDAQSAEIAIHLLQFMTDESTESPEYELVLTKILCGIETDMPIGQRIDITAKERQAIEGLIKGMIENWKSIGQTSVAGFRESFFQRRGRLALKDDAWHLKVEQRAFDMLLDSIPWGFATIKHPWMERVVYVKWR